jgi:hypothetical protein
MSITTGQQITKYFELYHAIDVTFTKEVIHVTGLYTQQVFLKCMGEQWPCVIYSTSFIGAKIVASVKPALFDKIRNANNSVSIRFSFKEPNKADTLTFFIAGKVLGFTPYSQGGGDLQFINVQYTQRPPDPLIEILGRMLEANVNSAKRRDERITVTPDSARRMGLVTKETLLYIQGVPRKCILRDISFSGAKVIIVGIAKFLEQKAITLVIDMEEPRESYSIRGTIVRSEAVEGRKDLAAVAIHFDEPSIPMNYKIHINDYLTQIVRKTLAGEDLSAASEPKAPPEPKAAPEPKASPAPEPKAPPAQ